MAKNRNRRLKPRTMRRWLELASYAGVSLGIFLIIVVCYFEFFAPTILMFSSPETELSAQVTPDAASSDETAVAPSPEEDGPGFVPLPGAPDDPDLAAVEEEPDEPPQDPNVHHGVVASGDTAGKILLTWLTSADVHLMAEACKKVYALTRLRVGQPYIVYLDNGEFFRFEYEINNDSRLIVTREPAGSAGNRRWTAQLEAIEYEIQLAKLEGDIKGSLFATMAKLGEDTSLAVRLAEIFAWEINFIRDIQPGDSFRMLVEKRFRDGEFKGYGRMPVAEFVNKKKKFEAFLFTDSFGNATYFNAAGDSLKRAFLKAPLSFTRISSRFNLRRVHPIFQTVRAHPAVDYAAPMGTPVKAIGSGVVTFRGFNKGAGNYITLKHNNGYESMYLHLSSFAKNLKKNNRVRQGEVIGYVGSTGYSTGPHLDFRMKHKGQFVNPEKILSPRDESVPQKQLPVFKAERELWRRYMEGELALSEYSAKKEIQVQ